MVVCDPSKFADCFLSPRRLRETLTLLGCSHTHAQHHDAPVGAFVDLGGHETWLLEDYLPDSVGDPSNQLVLPRWVTVQVSIRIGDSIARSTPFRESRMKPAAPVAQKLPGAPRSARRAQDAA